MTDYQINGKKSLERAECSVRRLREHFAGLKASAIDSARIGQYISVRLDEGAANATINRELAALKRMFNLAARCTPPKLDRVPHIALLQERNIRTGFFEYSEFIALRDALPEHLKGFVTFGYKSGWRVSEIKDLQWGQVDLVQAIVTLNPGETKNSEARTMYMDDELLAVIERQRQMQKQRGMLLPYVFTNAAGTDQLKSFTTEWNRACAEADIGERRFHDFRRTACRNMVRAGIPERVVMQISGHKTRSVFDRYNIVSDGDLRIAAKRQEEYLHDLSRQISTKTRTVLEFPAREGLPQ